MNRELRNKSVLGANYAKGRLKNRELIFRYKVRAMEVADAVKNYADKTNNLSILDLGCAEGLTLLEIDSLMPGNTFVGIECSQELISASIKQLSNITVLESDVENLPVDLLGSNSYDLVTALAVLEHLSWPLETVKSVMKALKPGGLFIATCPAPFWDCFSNKLGLVEDHHQALMGKKELVSLIRKAGFELIEYRRFMFAPVALLPYLSIGISSSFSFFCDRVIEPLKIFNWFFVNQRVIGKKPFKNQKQNR